MDFDASSFVFRPSKVNMMSAKNVRAWFREALHFGPLLHIGPKIEKMFDNFIFFAFEIGT